MHTAAVVRVEAARAEIHPWCPDWLFSLCYLWVTGWYCGLWQTDGGQGLAVKHCRPSWGICTCGHRFIYFLLFFFFLMTGAEVCYPVEMVHSMPLTNAFVIINLFFNHFCRLVSISRPPHHPAAALSCPQTHTHFSRSFHPVVLSTPSHTHTHIRPFSPAVGWTRSRHQRFDWPPKSG